MLRPSGCMNFLQNYNFFNKIKKAGNPYKSELPKPQNVTIDFIVGDKVRAPKYGVGEVKAIKSAGADYEVSVAFTGKGIKKFMAGLSKLIKVETE